MHDIQLLLVVIVCLLLAPALNSILTVIFDNLHPPEWLVKLLVALPLSFLMASLGGGLIYVALCLTGKPMPLPVAGAVWAGVFLYMLVMMALDAGVSRHVETSADAAARRARRGTNVRYF